MILLLRDGTFNFIFNALTFIIRGCQWSIYGGIKCICISFKVYTRKYKAVSRSGGWSYKTPPFVRTFYVFKVYSNLSLKKSVMHSLNLSHNLISVGSYFINKFNISWPITIFTPNPPSKKNVLSVTALHP